MTSPLAGVRVLDFGRYVAGPWCAQLLQGMGADVIRFERPSGGEDRGVFPVGGEGMSAYLIHCNRGKRCVGLNPTKPEGRAIVARLVGSADVIVANLPDDALATMGLDWPTVHATNPRAVLATATTFGTTGPYAGRLGFDGIGQVMSGAAYLSGDPGHPVKSFAPWVDYGTGANLALGVMGALISRAQTNVGSRVEASLLGTALAATGHVLTEQAIASPDRGPIGNRHPTAGPTDILATADGFVIVQVIGNAIFRRWCAAIGRIDLADDPRFASDESRGEHGALLSSIAGEWCATRTTEAVLHELAAGSVPAGALLSPQQALDDPHIRAVMLEHATVYGVEGAVPVVAPPFRLGDTSFGSVAPRVGSDTDDVLREVGCTFDEIASLRAVGVVA